jgi:hypothetical protein
MKNRFTCIARLGLLALTLIFIPHFVHADVVASQTSCDFGNCDDQGAIIGVDTGDATSTAQCFTSLGNYTLTSVEFRLGIYDVVPGGLSRSRLYAVSGSCASGTAVPSGAPLAVSSNSIDVSTFPIGSVSVQTYTFNPVTLNSGTDYIVSFEPDDASFCGTGILTNCAYKELSGQSTGNLLYIGLGDGAPDWAIENTEISWYIVNGDPISSGGGGMAGFINTATTSFESTTGVAIPAITGFMGDSFKLVAGSGLGVLQSMLPWIIALAVIGAIVYFMYRGFRFFRH